MYDLEPSTPTRDAPHPFDQRSADITLRTSDSVNFHIHTKILSQVSPFFTDMFTLPQPATPLAGSEPQVPLAGVRPVIDVAEDGRALEALLRLCYPVRKPELRHLDEIQPALEAAIKYDMARQTEELIARFLACAAQNPIQVWAFGCRHGLEYVARGGAEALRVSLPKGARERLSFLSDVPSGLEGLDGISAGQYFHLLQFVRCGGGHSDDTASPIASSADEDFSLLRPPRVATAPCAVGKRRVFLYLSLVCDEGAPTLENCSIEVHSPDIVCRCTDGTWFEVHQHILSLHSPVFRAQIAMLTASQPAQLEESPNQSEELTAALPVLELEGPSQAICTLLCICYQSQYDPHWSGLPDSRLGCIELLAVATQYRVQPTISLAVARWQALARTHAPNPGVRGVVMLRTAVAAATPAALGWCPPLRTRLDEYSRILEELPARTYHQLFVHLDACVRAAVRVLESATEAWELVAAERTRAIAGEPDAEAEAGTYLYQTVTEALKRRREVVERCEVAPEADHVRAIRWASYCGVAGPPSLRKRFKEDLEALLASLPREIDDAISEVKLNLG